MLTASMIPLRVTMPDGKDTRLNYKQIFNVIRGIAPGEEISWNIWKKKERFVQYLVTKTSDDVVVCDAVIRGSYTHHSGPLAEGCLVKPSCKKWQIMPAKVWLGISNIYYVYWDGIYIRNQFSNIFSRSFSLQTMTDLDVFMMVFGLPVAEQDWLLLNTPITKEYFRESGIETADSIDFTTWNKKATMYWKNPPIMHSDHVSYFKTSKYAVKALNSAGVDDLQILVKSSAGTYQMLSSKELHSRLRGLKQGEEIQWSIWKGFVTYICSLNPEGMLDCYAYYVRSDSSTPVSAVLADINSTSWKIQASKMARNKESVGYLEWDGIRIKSKNLNMFSRIFHPKKIRIKDVEMMMLGVPIPSNKWLLPYSSITRKYLKNRQQDNLVTPPFEEWNEQAKFYWENFRALNKQHIFEIRAK